MTYATLVTVQAMLPKLKITATSAPSVSDVTQYLQQRSDEIDTALNSRGFVTPVTAPAAFVSALARLNAQGAAADVLLGAFFTGEGNDRSSGPVLLKSYEQGIEDLQRGVGIPVGVLEVEREGAPRSYGLDNPSAAVTPDGSFFVGPRRGNTDDYGGPVDTGPTMRRSMPF